MERRPGNSGRVTFYKTAVLSQVPVLRKSADLFFFVLFFLSLGALVIIWSHEMKNRPG